MHKKLLLTAAFAAISVCSYAYKADTLKIHSDIMDKEVEAIVITPDKAATTSCPSVYLLHGHNGDYKFWPGIRHDLGELADNWGFIFVCPNAHNSWYIDSPVRKDSQYESFMTRELVPFVDSCYNTIPSRDKRAVSGLSMGGHGALFLAMRHPGIWGSAGSMSGCPDLRVHPNNWDLEAILGNYASNSGRWDEVCVVNQIGKIKNGELSIIIDCGEDDFMLEMNKDLHTRLLGAGIDHDFTTRPGTHWFNYWQNALDYHLLFHDKFFKKNGK